MQWELQARINENLKVAGLIERPLAPEQFVLVEAKLDQAENWRKFTDLMEMIVPKPSRWPSQTENWWEKFTHSSGRFVNYNWQKITLEQFAISIFAANLALTEGGKTLNSRFEILGAITAVTVDYLGVDFYEVQVGKSFATDFGID